VPAAVWFTAGTDADHANGNRLAADLLRQPPGSNFSLSALMGKRANYRVLRGGIGVPASDLPLQRAVRGELISEQELDIEFADGIKRTILINAATLRDARQRPRGAVAAAIDITARKLAEADQARLAAIVDSSSDAIISKTLDGVITSWNESASHLFGYSAAEMIGQSIRRLIPCERQAEEDMLLNRISSGERVEHYETVQSQGRCFAHHFTNALRRWPCHWRFKDCA
jgi:PAS domain S-box-containing protein